MTKKYPFDILNYLSADPTADKSILSDRPFCRWDSSLEADASRFAPGEELDVAINTAIAVGEPLLITGEPGTGKTQAAYYAAHKLGLGDVLHFQVKSTSRAGDLLYEFDTVRYFHDASVSRGVDGKTLGAYLAAKEDYVEKRDLWLAFDSETPRVLLIDEIDKAPRDFPNDLLFELDQMQFKVAETQQLVPPRPNKANRPIVFITSNSERRLPEPFLRRCVYHHIYFSEELLALAVQKRREEYSDLSDDFLKLAIRRFMSLREGANKPPSTGEFLVWLRVVSYHSKVKSPGLEGLLEQVKDEHAALPYAGLLLKNDQDWEKIRPGE
ncbi:MAG TPA: MoxR family ATPase [Pyrinomonadaceae bacterium]|jgi:MoxR-like ATPase|nr:MoxR family ATPase [Pyrinomonadaceae bacterium]